MNWLKSDLKKFQKRDPIIFEKIFRQYKNNLFDYFKIKAHGNQEIAAEVLSETFCSAIKSADKLKSTKNILSWLMQIGNRRFYDYMRKEYSKKNLVDKISLNTELINEGVDKELEEKEKILMTQIAIKTLKPNYKNVLNLKYIHNKSNKEIADAMNKSIYAVDCLLYKAKKLLKKKLKELL